MLCLVPDSFTMFNIEKVHQHDYGDIYRENMEARLNKDKSSGYYWRGKHKMKKAMQNLQIVKVWEKNNVNSLKNKRLRTKKS